MDKLFHYGIRGTAYSWLKSYLEERKQTVQINSSKSKYLPINCGVPQGSILGPLLFLLYINDLHNSTNLCITNHFADDTCLIFKGKKLNLLKSTVDRELKGIYKWLCANKLSLNVSKTQFLLFRTKSKLDKYRFTLTLNQTKLYESTFVKYLGVLIDNKLSWKHHINELSKRLAFSNSLLCKIRHYVPQKILRSLYYSLFNSHILYGCLNWSNSSESSIERIRKLQKSAIRIISFKNRRESTMPLFHEFKILTIDDQIHLQQILFMHDFATNKLPTGLDWLFKKVSTIHSRVTRLSSNNSLCLPYVNSSTHGLNSLRSKGAKILNNLNMSIYSDETSKYKIKKELTKQTINLYKS